MLSGVLITGVDAPTSSNARSEPLPAVLRIKGMARMPNGFSMDLKDCTLIAGSHGDLSSERAYLRAESLACIKDDGTVLESAISAFATGEDGKAGVRGRLVSKTGTLIGRSMLAGVLSGLSGVMQPARVPQLSLTPGANALFQQQDPSVMAQQSAMSGMHSAANSVANYYLDMAKNIFPVLEIDAGRRIDFIVATSTRLQGQPLNGQQRNQNPVGQVAGHAGAYGAQQAIQSIGTQQQAVDAARNNLPRY
jgi:conjugal transfer pilus assembly protein TraB